MTDELYSRDSYLRRCDAVVVEARDGDVVLDRTVFYPRGGGQPGDSGLLRWEGGECRVTDTTKARDDGQIVHAIDPDTPAPEAGTSVSAELDWDRRYQHMRTHTALHALSGVVFTDFDARVTGGNMDSGGTARMDFELDGISHEFGQDVEQRLNARLAEDVPVHVRFLPRAEALADPDLIRTKVSLIPESVDPIRVIDITGIDKQADGGTHVASSGEVGRVRVVKTESKGKANKRIRIQLEEP
ncbi:MAG: alanyl-tRNA editing protein [Actinomycetota bacterium]